MILSQYVSDFMLFSCKGDEKGSTCLMCTETERFSVRTQLHRWLMSFHGRPQLDLSACTK